MTCGGFVTGRGPRTFFDTNTSQYQPGMAEESARGMGKRPLLAIFDDSLHDLAIFSTMSAQNGLQLICYNQRTHAIIWHIYHPFLNSHGREKRFMDSRKAYFGPILAMVDDFLHNFALFSRMNAQNGLQLIFFNQRAHLII